MAEQDEHQDEQVSEQTEQVEGVRPVQPALTLADAGRACDVSRAKVRRDLDAGKFPHAYREQDAARTWRVPISDLIQAGYRPNRYKPGHEQVSEQSVTYVSEQGSEHREQDVTDLALSLARVEGDRDRWRSVAEERGAALARSDVMLRMLGVGTQPHPPSSPFPTRDVTDDPMTTGDVPVPVWIAFGVMVALVVVLVLNLTTTVFR